MSDHDTESRLLPYPAVPRSGRVGSIGDYWRFLQDDPRSPGRGAADEAEPGSSEGFFRDPEQFDFLVRVVFPELAARRRSAGWLTCNLWCIGCGTGEEAYSLALTAESALAALEPAWPWRIEATEPSPRALQRARIGVYAEEALQRVPATQRSAGFERGFGPQSGRVRVRSWLQENITFRDLSGIDGEVPFRERFHVILCRTLTAESPVETVDGLLEPLASRLVPGGYLITGRTRTLSGDPPHLHRVASASGIYRRPL